MFAVLDEFTRSSPRRGLNPAGFKLRSWCRDEGQATAGGFAAGTFVASRGTVASLGVTCALDPASWKSSHSDFVIRSTGLASHPSAIFVASSRSSRAWPAGHCLHDNSMRS